MKRYLPFLLLFIACQVFGQAKVSGVFDFNHPNTLNPSVTPSNINGGSTGLTGRKFTSGAVTFYAENSGALYTDIDASTNKRTYSLQVNRDGKFTLSVGSKDVITSVVFDGYLANLTLQPGQYGDWSQQGTETTVAFNSGTYNSVVFENNKGFSTFIYKITVNYTTKSSVLDPVCSIDDKTLSETSATEVSALCSMTLSFDRPMTVGNANGMTLTGKMRPSNKEVGQKMQVSAGEGTNTLTLEPQAPITTDGDFTIVIPSGTFVSTEGFTNKDLSFAVNVRENRATLEVESVTPRPGKIKSLSGPILLEFEQDFVMFDEDKLKTTKIFLMHDNVAEAPCNISQQSDNVIAIDFRTPRTYTDKGEWSIVVPEGLIHNEFLNDDDYDRWNPQITLRYYIDVDPDKPDDPQPGDSDLMKKAKELLSNDAYMGIGYPYPVDSVSGSRAALRALVDQQDVPSDEELAAAIGKFYTDTCVVMPTVGQWYNIVGQNANNQFVYLSYAESQAAPTTNRSGAAAFMVCSVNGDSIVFKAPDGKFVSVLSGDPNYTGMTSTDEPTVFNKLLLKKLSVAGVDSTKTFGLFSMSGLLLAVKDGEKYPSKAAINYTSSTPTVVDVPTSELYFDNEKSSGFFFVATESPESVTPVVTLSASQLPKNATGVKLTLEGIKKATLKDATKAYILQGNVKTPVELTAGEAANVFMVTFSALEPGTYTLVLPVGTFDFSKNDKPVVDKESLTAQFSISNETEENFKYTYTSVGFVQQIIAMQNRIEAVADVDLNEFVIFANVGVPYSGMCVDTTKTVRVQDLYTGKLYRTGHLVPYYDIVKDFGDAYEDTEAAKLVLDEPFEAGDIPEAFVAYCLPKGTIGDHNFGRYIGVIKDDVVVDASDCIANPYIGDLVMYVNNKWAAGITDITNATDYSGAIYDIQGRKVKGDLKSGIYIQNGKKIYIK